MLKFMRWYTNGNAPALWLGVLIGVLLFTSVMCLLHVAGIKFGG